MGKRRAKRRVKRRTIIVGIIVVVVIALVSFAFISANSHDTKIVIVSNSTLKNGDFLEILLTDDYRNVYPNETIDIKILDDSGWAHKYQVTTDEDGKGHVELLTLENGNYTVHCNFNGTLFNKASKLSSQLTIDDGLG